VRAVCYRLFPEGIIGSMRRNETNRVSRLLTEARERGALRWAWIVDETREPERVASWRDPAAFIRATRNDYRRDHWALQPRSVEVASEKGTVRGTLALVLEEYAVTFRVLHGYPSVATGRAAVEECLDGGQPVLALYIGDWDPSGLHMTEVDLPRRLSDYHESLCAERGLDGETEWPTITVKRIALATQDVVRGTRLSAFLAAPKRGHTRWALVHAPLRRALLGGGRPQSARATRQCCRRDWGRDQLAHLAAQRANGGRRNRLAPDCARQLEWEGLVSPYRTPVRPKGDQAEAAVELAHPAAPCRAQLSAGTPAA
jgi:hypothetical protein